MGLLKRIFGKNKKKVDLQYAIVKENIDLSQLSYDELLHRKANLKKEWKEKSNGITNTDTLEESDKLCEECSYLLDSETETKKEIAKRLYKRRNQVRKKQRDIEERKFNEMKKKFKL